MIQLRHTGLYVKDIQKQAQFYQKTFGMFVVCENYKQKDALISDLIGKEATVTITKLITEQGKVSGFDDMLELLQCGNSKVEKECYGKIFQFGCMHLGFGVNDIQLTVDKILQYGGKQITKIFVMDNGNKCCFCQDPESNWLELIEQAKR